MADIPKPNGEHPAAFADYVAAMSGDLAVLARRHGFQTLGYLLEMAKLEAENAARHVSRRDGR
jgi:hypothetical protein